MRFCRHIPGPPLGGFIDWLWYYDDWHPGHSREHVLPEGTFELVINLHEEPRKLFDRKDATRHQTFLRGWLSGTHSEYLVIDAVPASSMMGAHFKPGGCAPFLGMPADQLCDQVVDLEAIWGLDAWGCRDRLLAARKPGARFRVLEQFLLGRLAETSWQRPPRVAWALDRFLRQPNAQKIHAVTHDLGISHKHFILEFRREVGLTPKLFCRIRRFQEVLARIGAHESVEWADIAYNCGYFDQAHFVNDFQAFAGLNPSAYLTHRTDYLNYTLAAD